MTIGEPYLFSLNTSDGTTTLYPQARVYTSAGALVTTANLSHVSGGLYQASGAWTPSSAGKFTVLYTVYTDAGRTAPATDYDIVSEPVEVLDDAIRRILGLLHENTTITNAVFDGAGNMTQGLLSIYGNAADAAAGTNPLYTYTLTATYSGTQRQTFLSVKN